MANELLDALRQDIDDLQDQLNVILAAIENEAKQQSHLGKYLKVTTIVLGAFAATREGAAKVFPSQAADKWIVATYALIGLTITATASLLAALKFEEKGADFKVLAAKCNTLVMEIDRQVPKKEDTASDADQILAARKLIDLQIQKISEIQGEAAKSGLNITRVVRHLTARKPRPEKSADAG
jgi:hypothetical protein